MPKKNRAALALHRLQGARYIGVGGDEILRKGERESTRMFGPGRWGSAASTRKYPSVANSRFYFSSRWANSRFGKIGKSRLQRQANLKLRPDYPPARKPAQSMAPRGESLSREYTSKTRNGLSRNSTLKYLKECDAGGLKKGGTGHLPAPSMAPRGESLSRK